MNLDFILFRGPKAKYKFIDLWGETIFIPSYIPTHQSSDKGSLFSEFANCYKASKNTEVYFTIDYALNDAKGMSSQPALTSSIQQTKRQQPVDHYVPCLFLNSIVNSKYLVLYFHSAGEDIKTAHKLLTFIRDSYQVNVLAMEYPGYSIYAGSPSSNAVNQDAKTVYNYVVEKLGFLEENLIIIGRSIGTGIVLKLLGCLREGEDTPECRLPSPRAVGLISPFTSIKDLVRQQIGKLGTLIVKEQYNNIEYIKQVLCPVFIVHGKKDSLIPFESSKQLIARCKGPKQLINPAQMTHSAFDFYMDLVDPLREFLLQLGVNFYEQNMQGPTIPQHLFKLPDQFPI